MGGDRERSAPTAGSARRCRALCRGGRGGFLLDLRANRTGGRIPGAYDGRPRPLRRAVVRLAGCGSRTTGLRAYGGREISGAVFGGARNDSQPIDGTEGIDGHPRGPAAPGRGGTGARCKNGGAGAGDCVAPGAGFVGSAGRNGGKRGAAADGFDPEGDEGVCRHSGDGPSGARSPVSSRSAPTLCHHGDRQSVRSAARAVVCVFAQSRSRASPAGSHAAGHQKTPGNPK